MKEQEITERLTNFLKAHSISLSFLEKLQNEYERTYEKMVKVQSDMSTDEVFDFVVSNFLKDFVHNYKRYEKVSEDSEGTALYENISFKKNGEKRFKIEKSPDTKENTKRVVIDSKKNVILNEEKETNFYDEKNNEEISQEIVCDKQLEAKSSDSDVLKDEKNADEAGKMPKSAMQQRRSSVYAMCNATTLKTYKKDAETTAFLSRSLNKNILVRLLNPKQKRLVVDLMKPVVYNTGDVVIREGEMGTELFIVGKGILEVYKEIYEDSKEFTKSNGDVYSYIEEQTEKENEEKIKI
ncbi:hypothetical protein EDEG_01166 [Edhazardia aedis USNM 41457]|uniref:Cyclic nucleotide-binding domain-containing protein n=1 Tax=Edhazardia aedis (strain USNM 41457) TaxID=1003232 RepID=J9DAX0_EDHAE|nr:hypothetical protein EDEG_01166 [Edhazardia aedis USNM 41457]|eukprot:EJW04639.1 hypothetical protein EDEG_01166 [Edhazardia aedis USNM 41457]